MATMTDLKRPKPKAEKSSGKAIETAPSMSYDERPYCHRFTLEGPDLEKLGKAPKDFAGMEPIEATVLLDPITIRDITNKSTDKYEEKRNQSVEFQILKISLGAMSAKKAKKFDAYSDQQKKGPGE